MHLGSIGDSDGELVEIRPEMEPRGASLGEGHFERGRAGGAHGRNVAQAVRPDGT